MIIGRRERRQKRFIAHGDGVRIRVAGSRRIGAALLRDPRVRTMVLSWVRGRLGR